MISFLKISILYILYKKIVLVNLFIRSEVIITDSILINLQYWYLVQLSSYFFLVKLKLWLKY